MKAKQPDRELILLLEDYKNAIIAWQDGADKLGDGTSIRTFVNRQTPTVQKVVWRAGCGRTMTVAPPAMVGGLIMRNVNPFDCVFEGPYGLNVIPTICDMIDQAVGVIMAGDLPDVEETHAAKDGKSRHVASQRKVFVVHGHDNEVKQTVCRFLEKMKLEAIVLHERANLGMTIIEKFEKNSDVAYALVLMTPDDIGAIKGKNDALRHRSRQNVVFELGYFVGKLGRQRVCALVKGDLELPSDSDGIIYIAIDPSDGWKLLVGKELTAAGLDINLNDVM